MNYYDGNTVTGLWNYAQHFAMSDNSFGTTFGPSAPGAINLVSGDTGGVGAQPIAAAARRPTATSSPTATGGYSLIGDAQPYYDDCSTPRRGRAHRARTSATGSTRPASAGAGSRAVSRRPRRTRARPTPRRPTTSSTSTRAAGGVRARRTTSAPPSAAPASTARKADYIPHHEPFQYYASTANPHHLAPDVARRRSAPTPRRRASSTRRTTSTT